MPDVVIIGGGYAGLSAGALLAHQGFQVQLLEQDKSLGGRARVEERDGYLLDYGIHSHRLGENGPLARVFRELGDPIRFANPRHFTSYIFDSNRLLELPDTMAGLLSTPLLNPLEKLQFIKIILKMMLADLDRWYPEKLSAFLRLPGMTPGLEKISTLLGLTVMAENPEEASAGEVIDIFRRAVFSRRKVGDPVGGAGQIINTLEKKISSSGIINLNTRVTGLEFASGRVMAARTDQANYPARVFLFSAPINGLTGLVPENLLPPPLIEFANKLTPTSGLSLDFGLPAPITDIKGGIFNLDPVVIGRFPSNIDPLRAPPGKQLATWLRPISFPVTKEKIKEAEEILRVVIEKIFPGFFNRVEWERKLVHPVMDGLSMKPGQDFSRRPGPAIPLIPNLFLAGDTIRGHGSGGDIAFSSAISASDIIRKYLLNSNR